MPCFFPLPTDNSNAPEASEKEARKVSCLHCSRQMETCTTGGGRSPTPLLICLVALIVAAARILRPGDDDPQYDYYGVVRDTLMPPESVDDIVFRNMRRLQALHRRVMEIRAFLSRSESLVSVVGGLIDRAAVHEDSGTADTRSAMVGSSGEAISAADPFAVIGQLSVTEMAEAASMLHAQKPLCKIFFRCTASDAV